LLIKLFIIYNKITYFIIQQLRTIDKMYNLVSSMYSLTEGNQLIEDIHRETAQRGSHAERLKIL